MNITYSCAALEFWGVFWCLCWFFLFEFFVEFWWFVLVLLVVGFWFCDGFAAFRNSQETLKEKILLLKL